MKHKIYCAVPSKWLLETQGDWSSSYGEDSVPWTTDKTKIDYFMSCRNLNNIFHEYVIEMDDDEFRDLQDGYENMEIIIYSLGTDVSGNNDKYPTLADIPWPIIREEKCSIDEGFFDMFEGVTSDARWKPIIGNGDGIVPKVRDAARLLGIAQVFGNFYDVEWDLEDAIEMDMLNLFKDNGVYYIGERMFAS